VAGATGRVGRPVVDILETIAPLTTTPAEPITPPLATMLAEPTTAPLAITPAEPATPALSKTAADPTTPRLSSTADRRSSADCVPNGSNEFLERHRVGPGRVHDYVAASVRGL
jgi:hypothetical protein